MDHSLYGYLQQQSTQMLLFLLADYEKQDTPFSNHISAIIHHILNERQKADKQT